MTRSRPRASARRTAPRLKTRRLYTAPDRITAAADAISIAPAGVIIGAAAGFIVGFAGADTTINARWRRRRHRLRASSRLALKKRNEIINRCAVTDAYDAANTPRALRSLNP